MFIGETGSGKTHLVLDLIENQYNNHLNTSLLSAQRSEKIMKPIMLKGGSKTMIRFGL